MKKILFIDVDGTLVGRDGTVPASAVVAIREARKNGHLAFICTGRSKPEILPEIREIGFDGVIGAGGGYVEIGEEVVFHETMPKDSVLRLLALFAKEKIGYYLETNDGLFSNEYCVPSIEAQAVRGLPDNEEVKAAALAEVAWFINLLEPIQEQKIDYGQINKICFIGSEYPYEKVVTEFGEGLNLHRSTVPQYGNNSGEAGIKNSDKRIAVELVLDKLGLTKADAIGFGDGDNDLAMFAAVAQGIAMENATDNLKAEAAFVTDIAESDGLAKALGRLELI